MQDRFRVRGWSVYDSGYYDDIQNMLFGEEDNMTLLDAISKGLVSEIIPEQCTGLKDKNGRLIYEGDILRFNHENCVVFYDEVEAIWAMDNQKGNLFAFSGEDTSDMKIIGNVHENSELLEEK